MIGGMSGKIHYVKLATSESNCVSPLTAVSYSNIYSDPHGVQYGTP